MCQPLGHGMTGLGCGSIGGVILGLFDHLFDEQAHLAVLRLLAWLVMGKEPLGPVWTVWVMVPHFCKAPVGVCFPEGDHLC